MPAAIDMSVDCEPSRDECHARAQQDPQPVGPLGLLEINNPSASNCRKLGGYTCNRGEVGSSSRREPARRMGDGKLVVVRANPRTVA